MQCLDKLLESERELSGGKMGEWIRESLSWIDADRSIPRVAVVVSSRRDVWRAFPSGLEFQNSWASVPSDIEPTDFEMRILGSDLVIWGMTALKLFSNEHSCVLSLAKEHSLPVWALVVGTQRLSDRDAFTKDVLPANLEKLPTHSKAFEVDDADRTKAECLSVLDGLSDSLLASGRRRRCEYITEKLAKRLASDRIVAQIDLRRADRALSTAQAGVSSIEVLTISIKHKFSCAFNPALDALDDLVRSGVQLTLNSQENTSGDTLEELSKLFTEWKEEVFVPAQDDARSTCLGLVSSWCSSANTDLQRYLTHSDEAPVGAGFEIRCEDAARECTVWLDGLQAEFDREVAQFEADLKQDGFVRFISTIFEAPHTQEDQDKQENPEERQEGTEEEASSSNQDEDQVDSKDANWRERLGNLIRSAHDKGFPRAIQLKRLESLLFDRKSECRTAMEEIIDSRTPRLCNALKDRVTNAGSTALEKLSRNSAAYQQNLEQIRAVEARISGR